MKKYFAKIGFVAVLAAVAGYGVYTSQNVQTLSDLTMANVEALAYELPEVEVTCGASQGKCWVRGDLCMNGEYTGYRCNRSDNPMFSCTSNCR